jgi:hypothetical protein
MMSGWRDGVIEIVFGCGAVVRLRGEIGSETLRQASGLRQRGILWTAAGIDSFNAEGARGDHGTYGILNQAEALGARHRLRTRCTASFAKMFLT